MSLSNSILFLSLAVLWFCIFVQQARVTATNCPKRTDDDGRCKKPCRTDDDCKRRKKCLCDGPCGLSCIRTGQQCRTDYYDVPRGGKRIVNGLKFGDTVKYSCKRGLTLYGSPVLTCSGIRKWKPWDQGEPKCKRTCPDPGRPKDGRRIGNNFEVRKGVRFICNPGYDMKGPSMIICTRSLRWNGRVPICKVASCDAPQLPSRVSIRRGKQDSYSYGDMIYLTCSRGYALFGNSISRCLTNGWSNLKVRCLPKSCGHPGYLTNGQVIGHIFTYRSIVRYKCNRGYRLRGASSRICLHSQNWGGSLPRCEEKTCTSLPVLENGRFEGFFSKVGASKIAKCDNGYELVGATSVICSEDGWKFNGKEPKCLDLSRECENIQSILNGKPKRTILFEGDTLEYECNHKYQLEKRGEQKCRSGRIIGTYPHCILKECRKPVDPYKGHAVDQSYDDYDYAVYHCNKGYELEGGRQRCVNAKWIGSIPICKVQSCHHPGFLTNGDLHGRAFTYGSIVKYTCDAGYELRGSSTRKCLENKLWSGSVPRCIEINQKCINISPPLHGYLNTWNTEVGAKVIFTCKQGYDLDGAKEIECRRGGYWSSNVPKCVQDIRAQRCPILRVPQHGFVSPSADRFEVAIGVNVTFRCKQGYIENGAKELECKQGGYWSSDVPKCLQDHVASRHKGCWHEDHNDRSLTLEFKGMTPYAPNGHVEQCIVGCGDLHQSYAGIERDKCFCGNDYGKHGKGWEYHCYCKDTKLRKCGGNWRMSVYKTGCPKPIDPINGKAVDTFYSSGHRGKYKCNDGLIINGNGQVCDGLKWSGSIPKCEQDRTCSDSFADKNLDIIAPDFDDGTEGIYRCKGYYMLQGSEVTVCKDGKWMGNPKCLAPCATDLVGNYIYSSKHHLSGSTAKLNCPETTSSGAKERTLKCNDGSWILEHETDCKISREKSCPPPPTLANTIQERENDRVRYRCMNGYERKKKHRNRFLLKCVNGEWKGSAKKCQRSSSWCSANVSYPLKAAEAVVRHTLPQTFYCEDSFELSGSGVLLCNRGRVEGTFPKCEKNGCPSCNSDKKSVIDLCHESDVVFIATAKFVTQVGVVVIPKTILKKPDNVKEFQTEEIVKKQPTIVKQNGTGQCLCPSFKLKKDYLMFKTGSSQTFKAIPLELSNKNPKRATSQLAYFCKRRPR